MMPIIAMPQALQSFASGPFAPLLVGMVGLALLIWLRPIVRQTTMTAPWWWALLSLVTVASCEALSRLPAMDQQQPPAWIGPWQFAAAISTFCPMMAQLGAKRPQNRAWGFIVISLWAIVALPALESLVLQRDERLHVTDLRAWFLWALIAVGVLNMLPTRYGCCALLTGAAQVCLLADYLPLVKGAAGGQTALLGLVLGMAAIGCAVALSRRRAAPRDPWDLVWRDFRDLFGALWALRVAERVNAVAEAQEWEFSLRWGGFRRREGGTSDGAPSAAERQQRQRAMQNLLRRFVSPQWIATRLGKPVN